ncbi:IclR family transcriptional regulator [Pseudogemmobacter sonorensis]|uniref:IclR family transcriptional regulator n=1 Tax=Pseudogemmobacter sonorensis TaxID=2989681 RepID=UPI00369222E5
MADHPPPFAEELPARPPASVKSAARVLDLMELLGATESGLRLGEISAELSFPKSSCHMLLRTLSDRGYVERDDEGRYSLRRVYRETGSWVSGRFALLREIAMPELEALSQQINQTTVLGVLTSLPDIRVIATIEGRSGIRYEIPLGARFPLFCSAMGRCALAFSTEEFREEYFATHPRPQLTRHTITELSALRAAVERARERRFAINAEEHVIGVTSVAAPILDGAGRFLGSLNVGCITPSFHENGTEIERAVHEVGIRLTRLAANI